LGGSGINLLAGSKKDQAVYSESYPMGRSKKYPAVNRIQRAIYSGGYKLIWSNRKTPYLYNLPEHRNIWAYDLPLARMLESNLKSWLKENYKTNQQDVKISEEAMERLET
jgi:hypothetical protein